MKIGIYNSNKSIKRNSVKDFAFPKGLKTRTVYTSELDRYP